MKATKNRSIMADFICPRCGKLANTEQRFKRHERYCRTKKTIPTSRRRSCQACVKAKARCVPEGRGCTRCRVKRLLCELNDSDSVSYGNGKSITEPTATSQTDNVENAMIQGWDDVQDPYLLPEYALAPADLLDSGLDAFNFLGTFSTDFMELPQIPYDPMGTLSNKEARNLQETAKLFDRRDLGSQTNHLVAMASGILNSYPRLMRERRTFPPFIHPKAYGAAHDEWKLPVPLANAMSVSHMCSSTNPSFIWQTIRGEQERIRNNYRDLDQLTLLASIQALLVYILIRLENTPEEKDNFDEALLATFTEVMSHSTTPCGSVVRREELQGLRLPWKEWIYTESLRRTVIITRIIYQLFNITIYLPCPPLPYYAVAPLPASKLLWRADTEEEWEREWDREVEETPIHGMLNNGGLVKLKNGVTEMHHRKADWSRWYAGADELGLLVVLSASLR